MISVIKLSKKVYSSIIRWSYRHTELLDDVMMAMEQTKHGSEEIFLRQAKRQKGEWKEKEGVFMHFMQKILHKMLVICKKSGNFAADL